MAVCHYFIIISFLLLFISLQAITRPLRFSPFRLPAVSAAAKGSVCSAAASGIISVLRMPISLSSIFSSSSFSISFS